MAALPAEDWLKKTGPKMTGSVLDILIYVFDRYMLDEVPEVPEREDLARQLEGAGFTQRNVERALDWLADLACVRDALPLEGSGPAVRVFCEGELSRLSTECRGFLFTLERLGILSPQQPKWSSNACWRSMRTSSTPSNLSGWCSWCFPASRIRSTPSRGSKIWSSPRLRACHIEPRRFT
jgi:hypothetical protein